jgi:putative endonuclease
MSDGAGSGWQGTSGRQRPWADAALWTLAETATATAISTMDRSVLTRRAMIVGAEVATASARSAAPTSNCSAMPAAYVYLLRCRDGSLYCGWTSDLDRRLAAHRAGRASRYTASRLPVELALAQPMDDRRSARREEARIKRLTRVEKLALVDAAPHTSRAAV